METILNRSDYGDLFCLTHMEDRWEYLEPYIREDLHAANPLVHVTTFSLKTSYMGNDDQIRCVLFSAHPDDMANVQMRATYVGCITWAEFQRHYGPCRKITSGQ